MIAHAPIRVVEIDLDHPITDIDCAREAGEPYRGAWILVRKGGRAIGSVELDALDGRITAEALNDVVHAKLAPQPSLSEMTSADHLPSASVVVPTAMTRVSQLHASLASLAALDYPDYEVILVDNRSTGEPVEFPGVRVVREPRPGISAARNAGVAAAGGEIVAFTDDDVEVDPLWLRALGGRLSVGREVTAVTGLVVPHHLETDAQVWFEQSGLGLDRQYSPLMFTRASQFSVLRTNLETGDQRTHSLYEMGEFGLGSNMAFRVSFLREEGGFDLALGAGTPTHGGEDLAMLVRVLARRQRLIYEPSAIVWHKHRNTVQALERQAYGYGVGFTAMLTAITLYNPSNMIGLAMVLPRWLRSLRDPRSAKRINRGDGYPANLGRLELQGMVAGPLKYAHARRLQTRWQRATGARAAPVG